MIGVNFFDFNNLGFLSLIFSTKSLLNFIAIILYLMKRIPKFGKILFLNFPSDIESPIFLIKLVIIFSTSSFDIDKRKAISEKFKGISGMFLFSF